MLSHILNISQLPAAFKDVASKHFGENRKIPSGFMAHCNREMFHAQWEILLDDDFVEAYNHGMVILCPDGVKRRFHPRIFIYIADYPEKYE